LNQIIEQERNAFGRKVQLRHLRCLVAIAQECHLARAADRLSLSQPAVTKTLAELEVLAGARLVERGTAGRRGVQGLSAAGEQLLAHALRVLEAVDASAQAMVPAAGPRCRYSSRRRPTPCCLMSFAQASSIWWRAA